MKTNSKTKSESSIKSSDKSPIQVVFSDKLLLTISFFEGASVMIIELLGAKIIAPFFGTSLYVWASVLGVTLIALALGYFLGGILSTKENKARNMFIIVAIGSILTFLAPITGPILMQATSSYGVRLGSFLSVTGYLLPPLTCMGMVSPLITQLINLKREDAGKSAGTVFSISTLGGILATFLAGFYLIPELGIRLTAYSTSMVLAIIALYGLLTRRQIVIPVILIVFMFIGFPKKAIKTSSQDLKILYQSSGILGEWTVFDKVEQQENGALPTFRRLLLNGIEQTFTQVGYEPYATWSYPHKIAALAGIKPAGSKALLLGMGGGSISSNLLNLGFDLDIVDLDQRVKYISETYFKYDATKSNLIFDDARHYINQSKEKYDVVIFDLLNGEVQPSHVFTREGFMALKKILNDDALLIINFQGRFGMKEPALSLGPRSIFKTLEACNYKMLFCEKVSEGRSMDGDILFYGTNGNLDCKKLLQEPLRYSKIDSLEEFTYADYSPTFKFSLNDAFVLVDNKPKLELMNVTTILDWRTNQMGVQEDLFLKKGLPLFH